MTKHFDVAALGEAMVEFNQTAPGQPHYLQGFGGDTSNAVIAAARAGARTAYLTRLGDDSFGRSLLELWRHEGVDTHAVGIDAQAPTGIYFVTHTAQGHEFSYRRAGSAASRMTPDWLDAGAADAIRHAKILHVSGISMAISAGACDTVMGAMRIAREAGTLVALDSNLRLKLWPLQQARDALLKAMVLTDVFLPSLDDLVALAGSKDPAVLVDWSHAAGAARVVLKLGADGALASDGLRSERIPGHRVAAVDATGAGDCFCGNLLARLAQEDTLFEAARWANAAAAVAVQGFGAVAPLPRADQVRALL
ncbi:sugar kinase [Caenimonas terrae]|uniref:Sugar kinase n=1 Tax=Caenimonas terrae TaxID=696074 RepID=A0ABW0NDC9_9BURK